MDNMITEFIIEHAYGIYLWFFCSILSIAYWSNQDIEYKDFDTKIFTYFLILIGGPCSMLFILILLIGLFYMDKKHEYKMKKEGNMITEWLDVNEDHLIDKYIEKNLDITGKVMIAMSEQNITKDELADKLNIEYSEICNWLSGGYNFTLKNITALEYILNIVIITE